MSRIDHVTRQQQEYQAQYDQLTERVEAIQKDLSRTLDSEQKLVLEQRLWDLSAQRERVVGQLTFLEQRAGDIRVDRGSMPPNPFDMPIQIFLSYAREDYQAVAQLYDRLEEAGLKPWMDKKDILPGERWQHKLSEAIHDSHFFLACLSAKSVEKRGFLQKEFKQALDLWQEKLDSDIYLIPVRLDECQVPEAFRPLQWANLFDEDEWKALLRAIRTGAERQGLTIPSELVKQTSSGRTRQKLNPTAIAKPVLESPLPKSAASVLVSEQTLAPATSIVTAVPCQASPALLLVTDPIHLELVHIPAGQFLMGSDLAKDKGADTDEKPQHLVRLEEFYMGRYPMTNSQYGVFVKATKRQAPSHWKDGAIPSGKEEHPVVNVTWRDAVAFCQWLKKVTGRPFRLPTEAEWEKAASWDEGTRQKRIWPWGDTFDSANCNTTEGKKGGTTPVGNYPTGASAYGLLDMAGNVWEWCASQYTGYPYDPGDGRENQATADDVGCVLRGGSFFNRARLARCACRYCVDPDYRFDLYGFRICISSGLSL